MNIFEITMIEILLSIISIILFVFYFNCNYIIVVHKKILYVISKKYLEKIENEDIIKNVKQHSHKKYFLFDRNADKRWKFITKNKISKDFSLYEEDENLEIYELVKVNERKFIGALFNDGICIYNNSFNLGLF